MKLTIISLLFLTSAATLMAQDRYFTKTGHIDFFSSTPVEDIKAVNEQVTSFLDIKTGEMVFSVLMRSFNFEKALMQEHFNENYVESDTYPKATFEGTFSDYSPLDPGKPAVLNVKVKGKLSIHGVTREIEVPGTLTVEQGKIRAKSEFSINPEDYGIKIPQVVRKNIAEKIAVTVIMSYIPFKK
jgi:polyisoprenoid-binding protein YceI